MGSIRIANPGLLTTIQDYGRIGYEQYGIPQSGVMDRYSMEISNILAGNPMGEGVLEITMTGPVIEFQSPVVFALAGADMRPRLNGNEIEMYKTISASKGDILEFSTPAAGCRLYMAVSGGFDVKRVMESKSTYLRGGFGGFNGRALIKEDVLYINDVDLSNIPIRRVPSDMIPGYKKDTVLRVIMGPEEDYFTLEGINTFLNSKYTLTNEWDRMGCRLEGKSIEHSKGADIISNGISFGAVQVPGGGKPIIMMADRQTTGGYTKIANVISVDLPYLSQLRSYDSVVFSRVAIEEAQRLIREEKNKISGLINNYSKPEKERAIRYIIRVNGNQYNVNVEEI